MIDPCYVSHANTRTSLYRHRGIQTQFQADHCLISAPPVQLLPLRALMPPPPD